MAATTARRCAERPETACRLARRCARHALRRLQPRGLGERSRASGAPVRRSGGPRDCRLLRGGAGVRARRERAELDRRRCFAIMGPHPAEFVRRSIPARRIPSCARWCTAGPAATISSRCCGSCGRCSSSRDRSRASSSRATPASDEDVGQALDSFSTRALALDVRRGLRPSVPTRPGVCYFFPRPSAGSACKRLNLFLRWMVRRDEVDLGVWTRVPPAEADRAARHARHPPRPMPAADALRQSGLEDGGGHHRVAARTRSRRSGPLRFLTLPRRA